MADIPDRPPPFTISSEEEPEHDRGGPAADQASWWLAGLALVASALCAVAGLSPLYSVHTRLPAGGSDLTYSATGSVSARQSMNFFAGSLGRSPRLEYVYVAVAVLLLVLAIDTMRQRTGQPSLRLAAGCLGSVVLGCVVTTVLNAQSEAMSGRGYTVTATLGLSAYAAAGASACAALYVWLSALARRSRRSFGQQSP